MFIGHLPAGYLFAKSPVVARASRTVFWGVLLGSVVPDLDMLWFYLVDQGSTHHHDYLTHRPILWAAVLLIGALFKAGFLIGLGAGGLLHLALDSIAGKVTWGWPFSEVSMTLVTVQATHDHWIKSFLSHWTFKVELALVAIALIVFVRSNFKGRSE
ncbi:metal-dependent hydrolase [Shimia sp. R10_1]|uniref:metal-dependent hydrolase n=1 Tax=Shimia sp. R10_1 TaxID=2821095 RepID=UPI001ADABF8C|nr:metal-dependent hydrolase [Shimia sp. R10_1]MBO9472664.1 metal-dependent hydrolase [Shimia sp. R10_1]